ncbi:hypothetical protein OF122_06555 [Pelagibacterium flavum]|uniref:AbiEi antitoxin C-terminal domain-containing protein n=1 Tax=Pelagibacterium flavum TaxID=2984530 RepID=A0ABY6IS15_9HYPH|nr:type IV toxin-antitoxin system AbiEi family antitoxin [Pelagibacterium sp. YIM 151497]UYQ73416.1 hypothetical protein OF122_06555 [Pelagibacterium sp. YIM 151497]
MSSTPNHDDVNLRSLGPIEAKLFLDVVAQGKSSLTTDEAIAVFGHEDRARNAIKRLVSKGWLQSVGGGRYVVLPPAWGSEKFEDFDIYVLASASADVGYVGWWGAASRHGMTTQVPGELTVATDRQMPRKILQGNVVRYVKLSPKKFFGWQEMESMGRTFRASTPEKTIVDCVDRPELCGGPTELAVIVANGSRGVSDEALVETAIQHGSVSVAQRLGFLLDLYSPNYLGDAARSALRSVIPASARSVFGGQERLPDHIGYEREWGLLVNITEADLLAEVGSYTWGMRR